jgi:hypothetical protein
MALQPERATPPMQLITMLQTASTTLGMVVSQLIFPILESLFSLWIKANSLDKISIPGNNVESMGIDLTNHSNYLQVHSNTGDPQFGTFFGNYGRHLLVDFDFLF